MEGGTNLEAHNNHKGEEWRETRRGEQVKAKKGSCKGCLFLVEIPFGEKMVS